MAIKNAAVEEGHDAFVGKELFLYNWVARSLTSGVVWCDEGGENNQDLDLDARPWEAVRCVLVLSGIRILCLRVVAFDRI